MIKQIVNFLKKWFWKKPIQKKEKKIKPLATEINLKHFIIIKYKGKEFQLKRSELSYFSSLTSKQKKEKVDAFQKLIKKKKLKKVNINGKDLYVKTGGYDYSENFISDKLKSSNEKSRN